MERSVNVVIPTKNVLNEVLSTSLPEASTNRVVEVFRKKIGKKMPLLDILRCFVNEVNENFANQKVEMFGKIIPDILLRLFGEEAIAYYKQAFGSFMKNFEEEAVS